MTLDLDAIRKRAESAWCEPVVEELADDVLALLDENARLEHLIAPAPMGMGMHIQCNFCRGAIQAKHNSDITVRLLYTDRERMHAENVKLRAVAKAVSAVYVGALPASMTEHAKAHKQIQIALAALDAKETP